MNNLPPKVQEDVDRLLKMVEEGNLPLIREMYTPWDTLTPDRARSIGMWRPLLRKNVPKELEDVLTICLARKMLKLYQRPVAGAGDVSPSPTEIVLDAAGRERLALLRIAPDEQSASQPVDDWADYRDGPGGPWLTPKYVCESYGISRSTLSKNPDARKTRRKNPAGRNGGDHVYRVDVVHKIANRKPLNE